MSLTIFNYEDPSLFLRDSWNKKRAFNKNFTLRAWASQLGISSHGTFYQIVQGKRPLPKRFIKPLTDSLKLGAKESMYLETLVDYQRAKTLEHKGYYQERLRELAPGPKLSFYEIDTFHYLKNPLNGAIIELTNLKDFKFDLYWIKERLTIKVSLLEIQKSVALLLDLKLLSKDEHGNLKRSNEHLYTKQDIRNEALQEYHKNVLKLGSEQISEQHVDQREFNATALGVRANDLPKIKQEIRTFVNDFIRKYETPEGKAEEIYQLGIQFFGLTNKKDN